MLLPTVLSTGGMQGLVNCNALNDKVKYESNALPMDAKINLSGVLHYVSNTQVKFKQCTCQGCQINSLVLARDVGL